MPEARHRTPRLPAILVLSALTGAGLLAPLLANDRPLVARLHGRIAAPAFADLPFVGRLFDSEAIRLTSWDHPGAGVRVILSAPVPWSYRGVRLEEALRPPGRRHLLGTDGLGRDLLARLIHGARPSLAAGLSASLVALALGVLLGATAGLRGGIADLLIVRGVDVIACFPALLLALVFAAAGGGGLVPIIAAIALARSVGTARFVRAELMRLRGSDLFAAARATGLTLPRLAARHLLPLLSPPLLVLTAFGVAHAIVIESGLSFLGLGVQPPEPSWGTILAESRGTLDAAWWPVLFPAGAFLLTLGALCSLADAPARPPVGGMDSLS